MGANDYIYKWDCYDNGDGGGLEDVKYGTRPGPLPVRDGGGGIGAKPDDKLIGNLAEKLVTEYKLPCKAANEPDSVYMLRAQASCVNYVTSGLTRAFPGLVGVFPAAIIAGAASACRNKVGIDFQVEGVATCATA